MNFGFGRPNARFVLIATAWLLAAALAARGEGPIRIGDSRQLLVDDYLIAKRENLTLLLHAPEKKQIVMRRDAPWEGSGSDFERFIRDGKIIRMYYMATKLTIEGGTKMGNQPTYACYAESVDGITWTRPDIGLFEFAGSKRNNIVWAQEHLDNFTPFKDTNPDCPPDERYKALAGTWSKAKQGLYTLKSADGIHWSPISDQPITSKGSFDSQNNAFWDPVRKLYWCYFRGFHDKHGQLTKDTAEGIRDIRVATSPDFRHWSEPRMLTYADSPDEPLYTNQIEPYYRAPDIFVGFPTRYIDRSFSPAALQALPDPVHRQNRIKISPRFGTAITDGQFMTSRDGYTFHRWNETFLRPGPQRDNNWVYGDGYQTLGLLETPADDPTAEPELSFYAGEGEWKEGPALRRYTIRIDGFVSLHASQQAGSLITRPLVFTGKTLNLNFATSAAGSISVALEDEQGRAFPGFSAGECDEIFGDTLKRTVTWQNRSDVSSLAGKVIRIRMRLHEADLYSFKFEQ